MSWNNYNISIPAEIIPVGELVVLTTGSTWTAPGGLDLTPGPIYSDYVCTELLPQFRYGQLLTTHLDGYGNPIRLYAPPQGEAMGIKWNFTGRDIQAWGDPAVTNFWLAKCFCTNPCNFPSKKSMSGKTMNYTTGQYKTTNIGGSAFDNVNLQQL